MEVKQSKPFPILFAFLFLGTTHEGFTPLEGSTKVIAVGSDFEPILYGDDDASKPLILPEIANSGDLSYRFYHGREATWSPDPHIAGGGEYLDHSFVKNNLTCSYLVPAHIPIHLCELYFLFM